MDNYYLLKESAVASHAKINVGLYLTGQTGQAGAVLFLIILQSSGLNPCYRGLFDLFVRVWVLKVCLVVVK